MSEATRWTIKVSRDTDLSLRAHLGTLGMKKGDLSRFVEEAVRWRMFDQTIQGIKERNKGTPPEELEAAIEDALREVRDEMRGAA